MLLDPLHDNKGGQPDDDANHNKQGSDAAAQNDAKQKAKMPA